MKLTNEKLAKDILSAGKEEFLEKGFQGASMRQIAARLQVTTGAIYRYYTDKESIFEALVGDAARELEERYRRVQQEFSELPLSGQMENLPEVSEDEHTWMMEYIYDNFDAFKLISCCAVGTGYEHYLDRLIEIEVNSSLALIDKMQQEGMEVLPMDEDMIHIVASAMFNGMFETVRHDIPREKAIIYTDSLRSFYSAGWFKLLGISEKKRG